MEKRTFLCNIYLDLFSYISHHLFDVNKNYFSGFSPFPLSSEEPPNRKNRAGMDKFQTGAVRFSLEMFSSSAEMNSACGKVLPQAKPLVWWIKSP